jgi:predicted nucleic acid-binding protein
MLLGSGRFEIHLTVPLALEYEEVARRLIGEIPLTEAEIDDIIDYICHIAVPREIDYLWRPLLRDPKDDMVLELAVAGACDFIVTFNGRDFRGAEAFGIRVVTPKEFLEEIGELP